jgi:hypothetical protein
VVWFSLVSLVEVFCSFFYYSVPCLWIEWFSLTRWESLDVFTMMTMIPFWFWFWFF